MRNMQARHPLRPSVPDSVATAYDLGLDSEAWFAKIVGIFRAYCDRGRGAFGGIVAQSSAELLHFQADGSHPLNETLSRMGPNAGFAEQLGGELGMYTALDMFTPLQARLADPFMRLMGARDCIGSLGSDGGGLEIMFGAPSPEPARLGPGDRSFLRVMPHVGAGLRLRRSITGLALDTASVEALFDAEGRCVHAQGMAEDRDARTLLHESVRRALSWSARVSSDTDDDAREAIISGRWSLVERYEEGGRRYLVAYRNPQGVLDPRALSQRERDVAVLVAQGVSHKVVAAELGLSTATVAAVVRGVVEKLGLKSSRQLPLFWKDSSGIPLAVGRSDLVAVARESEASVLPGLTEAERQVLDAIVRGDSNSAIATSRRSSVRTVANQVASLLRKLGAGSRAELAALGLSKKRAR